MALGPAASLVEDGEGGVVFVWGMATWCWRTGDVVGRRQAAVGLVATATATRVEVAAGFGVSTEALRRWSRDWEQGGTQALAPARRGPKGPSKRTPEVVERIRALRRGGASIAQVATEVGLSVDSVRAALAQAPASDSTRGRGAGPGKELEALARPEPRHEERALARAGVLAGAPPVICEGASLPFAGALMILPALVVAGLVEAAEVVYGAPRAAFYTIRSLVLSLVFVALLGEPRAEGLTRVDPVAIGRLVGLDRAPEVKTIRRRMAALASLGRANELLMALARHHTRAHPESMGVLYVDGHVRAYHGGADLPRAHLARARIAMAATTDTWLADAEGNAVLVWSSPPGAALTGELAEAARAVRELLGPEACPTICFDRGGWSPRVFASLVAAGFHITTYRKGPLRAEPRSAFDPHEVVDRFGHVRRYLLSDRAVRVHYDGRRRYFACRQVTRLDPQSGHQTQVVTTRRDLAAPEVATMAFSRWREENLFRFMRPRGLDAMDSYAKAADDLARLVPNPAKAKMRKRLVAARAALAAAKEVVTTQTLEEGGAPLAPVHEAEAALAELVERSADIPAKVPLGQVRPDAMRLNDERKRIHDAIRMATWNAESTMAAALGPHYARAEDEAHSLLSEAFSASADLEVVGEQLHVRLEPLSAPRRSCAIAALCAELSGSETLYPGTNLRLVYSVKGY
ncbi:MAG: putative transposase [Acidimicrobiales bacterium]